MNDAAFKLDTQDIVVEEVFPHTPETICKTLTTGRTDGDGNQRGECCALSCVG